MSDRYIDSLILVMDKVEFTGNPSLQIDGQKKIRTINLGATESMVSLLLEARRSNHCIYLVGNGGSAGIAVHMAADFMKNGELRTQTFYDPALLTCMGNDYGFEYIFSKPLEIAASENDLLVAISSSGKSKNILNAVEIAQKKRCKIITFSGFEPDNPLRSMGDVNVYVPSTEYGIVESIHNIILQQVIDTIKNQQQ